MIILTLEAFCNHILIRCTKQILCDLDDTVCVTKVCKEAYPNLIAGFPEAGVEPLDPVKKDVIKMETTDNKVTLTDATLYGLKNCEVKEVRIHLKESTWDFYFTCPLLTIESKYEIHGKISTLNIEGKGDTKIVYDTYHIKIRGDYVKILLDDGDHMKLKNYVVDSNVKGKVEYNFTNLYNGNLEKSIAAHKFLNENWMTTKETILDPIINIYMGIFFDHLNKFLDIVPNEELFTYELD
ncbi:hypothetical protein K1T71_001374 [Dendrolimus kikuchii]|uniref:Uncharacterized protein n=1 Tax=Dendrolimus kikuchii TaxID=765133 RepID=A0ACC1DHI0_9NEOP|nr:hypothetical protein K1T71_001374 [Dendrolimus kikuchii]